MILHRLQRFDTSRYSPLRRVVALHDQLDNLLFHAFGRPAVYGARPANSPALDLYQEADRLVVKLEVPGMKKEDIGVSVDASVLTISGERKEAGKPADAAICRCERTLGQFERQVTLPWKVDETQIKATYTDGILTVTLPKAEEAKPKHIPIDIK
jgi:HSP20 family protein